MSVLTHRRFSLIKAGDPDASAFIAASGLTDGDAIGAVTGLVGGLKDISLWSVLPAAYPFPGTTTGINKWNLKDPRDDDDAFRLSFTGGTHSALGYRTNAVGAHRGSGNHADTHFVPLDELPADEATLAFYSTEHTTPDGQCEMGCYNWDATGYRHHIIAMYSGTTSGPFYWGMSENSGSNTSVPEATGLFVATRTSDTAQAAYRNGSLLDSNSVTGQAHPTLPVHIGRINTFADGTDRPCGFAAIGGRGLDASEVSDLYDVVEAYEDAMGRAA